MVQVLFDTVSGFISYKGHPAMPFDMRQVLWGE